jgi:hypothetical protein
MSEFFNHPAVAVLCNLFVFFVIAVVIAWVIDVLAYRSLGDASGCLSFVTTFVLWAFFVYIVYFY